MKLSSKEVMNKPLNSLFFREDKHLQQFVFLRLSAARPGMNANFKITL